VGLAPADAARGVRTTATTANLALPQAESATSTLISCVAMLLNDQGRLDEARPLCEESVAWCRAALGDAHPDTLTSVNNLATLLYTQGRLDEAQPLLEEALAGERKAWGDTHPFTLTQQPRQSGAGPGAVGRGATAVRGLVHWVRLAQQPLGAQQTAEVV
jgi:hypothetical protein